MCVRTDARTHTHARARTHTDTHTRSHSLTCSLYLTQIYRYTHHDTFCLFLVTGSKAEERQEHSKRREEAVNEDLKVPKVVAQETISEKHDARQAKEQEAKPAEETVVWAASQQRQPSNGEQKIEGRLLMLSRTPSEQVHQQRPLTGVESAADAYNQEIFVAKKPEPPKVAGPTPDSHTRKHCLTTSARYGPDIILLTTMSVAHLKEIVRFFI